MIAQQQVPDPLPVFDTVVLSHFALADRLDVLGDLLLGQRCATTAVHTMRTMWLLSSNDHQRARLEDCCGAVRRLRCPMSGSRPAAGRSVARTVRARS